MVCRGGEDGELRVLIRWIASSCGTTLLVVEGCLLLNVDDQDTLPASASAIQRDVNRTLLSHAEVREEV